MNYKLLRLKVGTSPTPLHNLNTNAAASLANASASFCVDASAYIRTTFSVPLGLTNERGGGLFLPFSFPGVSICLCALDMTDMAISNAGWREGGLVAFVSLLFV